MNICLDFCPRFRHLYILGYLILFDFNVSICYGSLFLIEEIQMSTIPIGKQGNNDPLTSSRNCCSLSKERLLIDRGGQLKRRKNFRMGTFPGKQVLLEFPLPPIGWGRGRGKGEEYTHRHTSFTWRQLPFPTFPRLTRALWIGKF